MKEAPIGPEDAARVAALRALGVLDTRPEERFDRITRLAAHLLDVPIALVSLVDESRQWFKSRVGLDATQTPRNISFCGHAIQQSEPFIIPNAAEDPRFADNPLVSGPPGIRFYAGIPLKALDGKRLGTLCTISDRPRHISPREVALLEDLAAIVEQELMSAELAHARDAALAASKAKSEFLATMSHEIRTPLHAIIGLSELLLGEISAGEHHQTLQTIHHSGRSLLSLIDDILDLSKIESGQLELTVEPFSLRDLLHAVRRVGDALLRGKAIELTISVRGDVPDRILGDVHRYRQILTNLVGNAVKFTAAGQIGIRARVEGGTLELEVSDTGIGMSPSTLARAFDAFAQADASTSRRYGGSGLGLPIARRLAERMGGEIHIESEQGVGTRVVVRTPLVVDPMPTPGPVAVAPSGGGASILVVDDDPINLMVVVRMLEKLGFSARGVDSGAACLEVVAHERFDLILMDAYMPEMDGMETTRALVADALCPGTPIVGLSASAFESDRAACTEAGMSDFITKPVQLEDLNRAIVRNLDARPRA